MKIEKNILKNPSGEPKVSFDPSINHGEQFHDGLPDTIVIHYTAGSSLESSVAWLKNPQSKASAHVIVGKSGEIVQLVPFNQEAWHAGQSQWKKRSGLNHFSIGIEIDNAGLLDKRADGYYTHFGKRLDNSQVILAPHKHGNIEQAWEAFSEKQIETVEQLCLTLREEYPISEIVGHDEISPGRKIDPGPAFPLKKLRDKILTGRKNNKQENDLSPLDAGTVTADLLNIRSQPDFSSSIIANPLSKGTKLRIMENRNGWMYVKVDLKGWVSEKWVKKI